jgi:hypothetical protein
MVLSYGFESVSDKGWVSGRKIGARVTLSGYTRRIGAFCCKVAGSKAFLGPFWALPGVMDPRFHFTAGRFATDCQGIEGFSLRRAETADPWSVTHLCHPVGKRALLWDDSGGWLWFRFARQKDR